MSIKLLPSILPMIGLLLWLGACRGNSPALAPAAAANSELLPPVVNIVVPTLAPTPPPTMPVTAPVTTTIAVTTPAGVILAAQLLETVPITEINRLSPTFYYPANLVDAQYAVDVYRLIVQSRAETGAPIDLQTDLFVPRVITETAFPVLVYAPGTTGLDDSCAPSQEYPLGRSWGDYRTHSLSYAAQGFITLLPDGPSYTDPARPQEYFVSELEAYTLLDTARAAYNFFAQPPTTVRARPQPALFLAGYSNGGHAAFAAKDLAAAYAPELPLRGVISHGATTNVETLLRESPIFAPYLIYAYRHFFGATVIKPADIFLDRWLTDFEQDVLSHCVNDAFVYYSNDPRAMYRPAFRTVLLNGQLGDSYPLFKAVLDANYAGAFGGFAVPVAFFQGTADHVVTPVAQQQFAAFLCAQGQPVTYVTLPTVQHVDTRQAGFQGTMAWMRSLAAGQTPPNDCAQITAGE